jgi:hypothetical protein
MHLQNSNAEQPHLAVRSVRVDPAAHVAPVVMTNEQTGDAIIWLVDHDDHPAQLAEDSLLDALPAWTDHPPPLPELTPRERQSGGDL